jgi:predicted outer membrane protein
MRKLIFTITLILMLPGVALAQTTLLPDTPPRVPPQAGQGLPQEDRQFINRAFNLSEAEIEAGRLAVQKADVPAVKDFSQRVAAAHEKLRQTVQQLAQKHDMRIEPHASREWWQSELKRIGGLQGQDFDRQYMDWQLKMHLALADLYQTQASQSPEQDLSKFAITALAEIQKYFDGAKRLGGQYGVAIDTIKPPPQY